MTSLLPPIVRAGAAATALAFLAGAAHAQGAPPLPSMPPPPSVSDPAPKAAAPKKGKKAEGERKLETGQNARRSGSAASFERPSQYVPEEFDRGGGSGGGGARPFMTESGRPGMGMRF